MEYVKSLNNLIDRYHEPDPKPPPCLNKPSFSCSTSHY